MAIKFVVFDTATGRNTTPANGDAITLPGIITISGVAEIADLDVTDLDVTGVLHAEGRAQLGGRYPHINADKTGLTTETSGLIFQINGSASPQTIQSISSSGTLTMFTDPTGTYSSGDLVQIQGSAIASNNGIYEVDTVTTMPDEIVLALLPADDFSLPSDSLIDDLDGVATVQKINIAVLRYNTAGTLQTATGSTAGLTFTDVGGGGGGGVSNLQEAYVGGNTITTNSTSGAFTVAGDQEVILGSTGLDGISLTTSGFMAGDIHLDSAKGIVLSTSSSGSGGGISIDTTTDNGMLSVNTGNGGVSFSNNNSVSFSSYSFAATTSGDAQLDASGSALLTSGAITTNNIRGAFEAIARSNNNIDDVGVPVYAINNAGTVNFAAADASALSTAKVVGISVAAQNAAGSVFDAVCLAGSVTPVRFAVAPAASSIGSYVYLSETTGRATLTPPATAGSVVFELGILVTADGSSVLPKIIYQPRFVIEN